MLKTNYKEYFIVKMHLQINNFKLYLIRMYTLAKKT